jgi:integrase
MSAKATSRRRPRKQSKYLPPKPDGFPLTPHYQSGRYIKKIDGKIQYFGRWGIRKNEVTTPLDDPGYDKARAEYEALKAELDREQETRERHVALAAAEKAKADEKTKLKVQKQILDLNNSGEFKLAKLCNLFLHSKKQKLESGELVESTYIEYEYATDLLIEQFGGHQLVSELRPTDFAGLRAHMLRKWESPARIAKFLTMTRSVFKYLHESEYIEHIPSYGPDFKPLAKNRVAAYEDEGGVKLFTRNEVQALLNGGWTQDKSGKRVWVAPTTLMRAMIFLGINCGFGNKDVGTLPLKAIDLKNGIIRFPRPKTRVKRESPLWPETIKAIEDTIAERQTAKCGTLFVTKYGNPWFHGNTDAIKKPFGKLLNALGINGRRSLGFYTLRHTFATVSMELDDRDAVKCLMGHTDPEMIARYNKAQVPLKRRQTVVNYVRKWLAMAEKTSRKPR